MRLLISGMVRHGRRRGSTATDEVVWAKRGCVQARTAEGGSTMGLLNDGGNQVPCDWGGNGLAIPSGDLPTVPSLGAPPVFYIMQATDSVTNVRFDWKVPGSPDSAGVGYPGPNAPTDIVVAGRNP